MPDYTRLDGQPMHAQTFVCTTCQHTAIGPALEAEARIKAHVATHAAPGVDRTCLAGHTYHAPVAAGLLFHGWVTAHASHTAMTEEM